MTAVTRRNFLRTGSLLGVGTITVTLLPGSARALDSTTTGFTPGVPAIQDDPTVKAFAMGALDAARTAGAAYADVRLMRTDYRSIGIVGGLSIQIHQSLTIGVRSLVNGYWGFASSPVWSLDEAARLGREAVGQAKVAARGKPRLVELAPTVSSTGHWQMPVQRDPVTVPFEEYADILKSWEASTGIDVGANMSKFEEAIASTDGTYCTQIRFLANTGTNGQDFLDSPVPVFSGAGAGWEYIRDYPIRELQRVSSEYKDWVKSLPVKPAPVGRFPVVLSPSGVAVLLSRSLGSATELTRIMGYEANNEGTSYLSDPLSLLGSYRAASTHVSVSADWSMPLGCATRKWDAEGSRTSAFTLIDKGILADCLTTRESASWIAPWYAQSSRPLQSNACAVTGTSALEAPKTASPNLVLQPSPGSASLRDLISQISDVGYVSLAPVGPDLDQQRLSGMMQLPSLLEVRRGKITGTISGWSAMMFRTPELWKSVSAVGGAKSARQMQVNSPLSTSTKIMQWGAPVHVHTVSAVPILLKEATLIDIGRKGA